MSGFIIDTQVNNKRKVKVPTPSQAQTPIFNIPNHVYEQTEYLLPFSNYRGMVWLGDVANTHRLPAFHPSPEWNHSSNTASVDF
jgi:hypothetical protein